MIRSCCSAAEVIVSRLRLRTRTLLTLVCCYHVAGVYFVSSSKRHHAYRKGVGKVPVSHGRARKASWCGKSCDDQLLYELYELCVRSSSGVTDSSRQHKVGTRTRVCSTASRPCQYYVPPVLHACIYLCSNWYLVPGIVCHYVPKHKYYSTVFTLKKLIRTNVIYI